MTKFPLITLCVCLAFSGLKAADNQVHRRQLSGQRSAQFHSRNVGNQTGNSLELSSSGHLDRLYSQVASISALGEEQLRRLDVMESKMARLEVSNKERLDEVREELREISKKMQKLEWMGANTENHFEDMKNEIDGIRVHLMNAELQSKSQEPPQTQTPPQSSSSLISDDEKDNSDKLTSLAILLTSTRTAVLGIQQQIEAFSLNITKLSQVSRELNHRQHSLPSKQFLNNALNSLRNQPVYLTPNGPHYNPSTSSLPGSCQQASSTKTGIVRIQANPTSSPFYVMCDGSTQDGGWTVIQRRLDGTINFNRNWLEYKNGFGNIAGEFFIGLDKLHDLTSSSLHELLIVMEDFQNVTKYARYSEFAIAGEKEDYALNLLGRYDGTAGDSLSFSAGYKFSTFDNDNDGWVEGNCAQAHTGAWWYNACEMSNLNGQFLGGVVSPAQQFQGVFWNEFHGPLYSLKSARMMIRPVEDDSQY